MVLQACAGCRRHIGAHEVACPFCGAAVFAQEPRPIRAGRFARAVMFAGASFAGCDQGKGAQQNQGAQPNQVTKQPVKAPAAAPGVHGKITDESGGPLVGAQVTLTGTAQYQTLTDHRGRYRFEEIAPGDYQLVINYYTRSPNGDGSGYAEKTVFVSGDEQKDVTIPVRYQQPAMPYGAPPRRHRVV